jgi:hypothetical protein
MLSAAVLVVVSGAGLRMGSGVVEAQRKGQPPVIVTPGAVQGEAGSL